MFHVTSLSCNKFLHQIRKIISARKMSRHGQINEDPVGGTTVTLTWHANKYKVQDASSGCKIISSEFPLFVDDVHYVIVTYSIFYFLFYRAPSPRLFPSPKDYKYMCICESIWPSGKALGW